MSLMDIIRKTGEREAEFKLKFASDSKDTYVKDVIEVADRNQIIQGFADKYVEKIMKDLENK